MSLDAFLSPFVETVPPPPAYGATRVLVCNTVAVEAHIDFGLFNIVVATRADLRSLFLQLTPGGQWACAADLPPPGPDNELLLVVVPGYSLSPVVPGAPSAIRHKGETCCRGGAVVSCLLPEQDCLPTRYSQ